MPHESRADGPGGEIPEFHAHVAAGAREGAAIAAEGDGRDVPGVAGESVALGPGGRVPQAGALVVAAGQEPAAIGAQGEARDLALVAGKSPDLRLGA